MFEDCINHTSREWPHVESQEHTHNSNPIPGPEESAGAKESGEAGYMSCLCFACCCFVKLWVRDLQASVATMLYYTSIRCFLFLPPIIHMLQDFETIRILYNMIFHTGTVTPESKEVISTIQNPPHSLPSNQPFACIPHASYKQVHHGSTQTFESLATSCNGSTGRHSKSSFGANEAWLPKERMRIWGTMRSGNFCLVSFCEMLDGYE